MIDVNISLFAPEPEWRQQFIIRHECCHLLNQPDPSPTLQRLVRTYPREMLGKLVSYRRHLNVHKMMIDGWMEDWLQNPIRLPDKPGSPPYIYRSRKKQNKKNAILYAITCSAQIIYCTYLNEYLLSRDGLPEKARKKIIDDLKRYRWYLDDWWKCLQRDAMDSLSSPEDWLTLDHFNNGEKFFSQITNLLKKLPNILS